MSYADLLARKRPMFAGHGVSDADIIPQLFPWQARIVRWALRKGRAAIWADCGLGKTPMQLAWAHALGVRTLILAPLCVADQTVSEAAKFGISARYAADESEAGPGINVTNYDRLHKFDAGAYGAVVLDESSILKAFDGKTRRALIEAFSGTRFRLCCTATPAPNDVGELGNHAEFLGLMKRSEFLATWFVHDQDGWRMKKHARAPFFRWLASWAVALRTPSDIGGDDAGFSLPALNIHDRVIRCDRPVDGFLFSGMAGTGLRGRLRARRASLDDRVGECAELARQPGQWIFWCGLNDESEALTSEIPGAIEVRGADSHDEKRRAIDGFIAGDFQHLVTKIKIAGFGMNFQHCAQMAFVGMNDSYEGYYQGIRRCWRFGQSRPVDAHIVISEAESVVIDNVRHKEAVARSVASELIANMSDFEREELCA